MQSLFADHTVNEECIAVRELSEEELFRKELRGSGFVSLQFFREDFQNMYIRNIMRIHEILLDIEALDRVEEMVSSVSVKRRLGMKIRTKKDLLFNLLDAYPMDYREDGSNRHSQRVEEIKLIMSVYGERFKALNTSEESEKESEGSDSVPRSSRSIYN